MIDIRQLLEEWQTSIEVEKVEFFTSIFDLVDIGKLFKLDALRLLTNYELLPITDWIEAPEFMYNQFTINGNKAKNSIFYYIDDLYSKNFGKDAFYKKFTLEEGINLTYDFVKKYKVIGCKVDW